MTTLLVVMSSFATVSSQELAKFKLGGYSGYWVFDNVHFKYGIDTGAYRTEGLDVELTFFRSVGDFAPALYRGDVDAVTFLKTAQICHEKRTGCDLTIPLVTSHSSPYFVMASTAVAEQYRSIGELVEVLYRNHDDPDDWGAIGAVNNCSGTSYTLFTSAVWARYPDARVYCGDENPTVEEDAHVILRPSGNSKGRTQAVARQLKGVDIGLAFVGQHLTVRKKFDAVIEIVSTPADISRNFALAQSGLVTRGNISEERLCKFIRGYRASAARWRANPAEAQSYIKEYHARYLDTELSDAEAAELYAVSLEMLPPDGNISPASAKQWAQTMFADESRIPEGLFSFRSCS